MGLDGYPMKFSFARMGPPRYSVSFAFVGNARYTGAKVLTFVATNTPTLRLEKGKHRGEREERRRERRRRRGGETEETEEMLTVGLREASLRSLGPGVYATR